MSPTGLGSGIQSAHLSVLLAGLLTFCMTGICTGLRSLSMEEMLSALVLRLAMTPGVLCGCTGKTEVCAAMTEVYAGKTEVCGGQTGVCICMTEVCASTVT